MHPHLFNFIGAKAVLVFIGIVSLSDQIWASESSAVPTTTQAAQDAYERANIETKKGNSESAIAAYTRAINLDPSACMAYAYRGAVYEKIGNYNKALADYTAAIELKPDAPIASAIYSDRGYLRKQNGELSAAIADYNKAAELDPKNSNVLIKRGMAMSQMGNPQAAIVDFSTACELDPLEYRSYNGRGMARADLGDFVGALADVARAIKLSPNNPVCYLSYGYVLREKRDYSGAIEAITNAVELSPKNPSVTLLMRASTFMEMGDTKSALVDLNKIRSLTPDFFRVYVQLGDLYFIEGKLSEALDAYNKALSIAQHGERIRYAKIRAFLIALRLNRVAPKEDFVAGVDDPSEGWTKSIEHFVRGELGEKYLLDNAIKGSSYLSATHLAEAYFYIGELAIIKGDFLKARVSFGQCLGTDRADVIEFFFAKSELARLVEKKNDNNVPLRSNS